MRSRKSLRKERQKKKLRLIFHIIEKIIQILAGIVEILEWLSSIHS